MCTADEPGPGLLPTATVLLGRGRPLLPTIRLPGPEGQSEQLFERRRLQPGLLW
jgi:hypothetical protein